MNDPQNKYGLGTVSKNFKWDVLDWIESLIVIDDIAMIATLPIQDKNF